MAAPIPLRRDYDAAALRQEARSVRIRTKSGAFWHWPRSTPASHDPWRRRSAVSVSRRCGTGAEIKRPGPAGLLAGKAPGKKSILKNDPRGTRPRAASGPGRRLRLAVRPGHRLRLGPRHARHDVRTVFRDQAGVAGNRPGVVRRLRHRPRDERRHLGRERDRGGQHHRGLPAQDRPFCFALTKANGEVGSHSMPPWSDVPHLDAQDVGQRLPSGLGGQRRQPQCHRGGQTTAVAQ